MNNKITKISDKINALRLSEIVELTRLLEAKFGVSIESEIASSTLAQDKKEVLADSEIKSEEKTSFDLVLTEISADKKIATLKAVRVITGLGLKESKDLVDNIPKPLKEGISKDEIEKFAKELELAGAKYIIK